MPEQETKTPRFDVSRWGRYAAHIFAESRKDLERGDLMNFVVSIIIPAVVVVGAAVGIGVAAGPVPAGVTAVVGVIGLLFLWAIVVPSRVWEDQNKRIGALEDERKVKLVVEAGKLDSFAMPQDGIVLNVDADGLDQVVDCTTRVLELVWDAGVNISNGIEQSRIWKTMFVNENIYLHEHNGNPTVPTTTFKGATVVLVAHQVPNWKKYRLGAVGGKEYLLPSGTNFLAVEVGAKNTASQRCAFKIYVPFGTNEEITMEKVPWDQKPAATL